MGYADQITTQRDERPPRYVIHGHAGIGKTTLATSAKQALLIPVEEGTGVLSVPSLPKPNDWEELTAMLREVIADLGKPKGEREFMDAYQSLIIDSIDRVEPLIWQAVCAEKGKKEIEDFGYGKGYTYADKYWIKFLQGLDMVRREGVAVIIIAHTAMLTVDDPVVGSYSRFAPKLHKRANALLLEWSDIVGFLDVGRRPVDRGEGLRKTRTTTVEQGAEGKTRYLHLEDAGGFVAKNRYALPAFVSVPKNEGFAVLYEELDKAIGASKVEGTDDSSNTKGKKA